MAAIDGRRRANLQARIDQARRCLSIAEACEADCARQAAQLRSVAPQTFALANDEAKTRAVNAIERAQATLATAVRSAVAVRLSATAELQMAQIELNLLNESTRLPPDGGLAN